jgi:transcriptional regulator with XRE-family HTH domain
MPPVPLVPSRSTTAPPRVHRTPSTPVGALLREWRERRRLSQLQLAADAGVSSRHLSFLETGRSRPSREMLLHLAEHLEVPLRQRNAMLLAAGFAPAYGESSLAEPELVAVREAVDVLLAAHDPYPAVVVDRRWDLVAANASAAVLLEGVAPALLGPPTNVLRAALHPDGVAPRIVNLPEVAEHLITRLRRQAELAADPELTALADELAAYPSVSGLAPRAELHGAERVVIPIRLRVGDEVLAMFSTLATFGTAVDVTVAELAIESFFPADRASAELLRRRAERQGSSGPRTGRD